METWAFTIRNHHFSFSFFCCSPFSIYQWKLNIISLLLPTISIHNSHIHYTYFHMIHLTSPMNRKILKHLFSVFFFVLSIFISDSTLILLFNFSLLDTVWKCLYFHSNTTTTTTNGIFSFFSKVTSVYYYWDAEMISILCSETMRVYCISRKYNQKNINRLLKAIFTCD